MNSAALLSLAMACAPQVHPETTRALVQVESSANPWAIGVVGGALERQPRNQAEAITTAQTLRQVGWNFSVGLAQINVTNFGRLGLTLEEAFEPCANLAAMQMVLGDCFDRASRAKRVARDQQDVLRAALSCYYSGNFTTGLQQGYVHLVTRAALRLGVHSTPLKELP